MHQIKIKKEPFFDSSFICDLLEETFTSQSVINPLMIDLFLNQNLKRKDEELATLLNKKALHIQSHIDDLSLRLSTLENKKSKFKKGTDKITYMAKRLIGQQNKH